MSVTQSSELVTFDADAAVEAARNAAGDDLHLCVEYTAENFHVLYADDLTRSLYGDRDAMSEHFQQVHSYVNVDFTEMELFEDLMVAGGRVQALVTYMDNVALVRVLRSDREGLFLTLDPDAPVTQTVEAVRGVLA